MRKTAIIAAVVAAAEESKCYGEQCHYLWRAQSL